jgi:hypothetical protein
VVEQTSGLRTYTFVFGLFDSSIAAKYTQDPLSWQILGTQWFKCTKDSGESVTIAQEHAINAYLSIVGNTVKSLPRYSSVDRRPKL